ncbi:unnamed protein product, partial [Prorocentrum cordatum]
MGPRPFSWCTCGNWIYNFRLHRNGGVCDHCKQQVELVQPGAKGAKGGGKGGKGSKGGKGYPPAKYPWRTATKTDVGALLKQLLEEPALSVHAEAIQYIEKSYTSSLEKKRTPNQEVTRTGQTLERKEAALKKTNDAEQAATLALEEARAKQQQAAIEAIGAQQDYEQALQVLAATAGAKTATQTHTSDGKRILLAVEEFNFTEFDDDYDEAQRLQLTTIQKQVEAHIKQVEQLQVQMAEALRSVKQIRAAPAEKMRPAPSLLRAPVLPAVLLRPLAAAGRRGPADTGASRNGGDATLSFANVSEWGPTAQSSMQAQVEQYDVLGFAETHLRGEKLDRFHGDLARDGWKTIATPSVATGRSVDGTTGGEAIIAKKTLATTSFEGWRQYEIARTRNSNAIAAYMQPKFGFQGPNGKMLIRLASFLQQLTADPNSKRQKAIAERRAQRQAALDHALQEAYAELHQNDQHTDTLPTQHVGFAIPLDLWEKSMGSQIGSKEGEMVDVASDIKLHYLLQRDMHGQNQIAERFAAWAHNVEKATLVHHDIPEDKRDEHMGRDVGYAIGWKRTRATPCRPHMRDPLLEWWHLSTTPLVRDQHLRRTEATLEASRLEAKIAEILAVAVANDLQTPFQDDDELFAWIAAVGNLSTQPLQDIQDLIDTGEKYKARAIGISLTRSWRAYTSWATKMWKQAPGLLHKHVKPPAQPKFEHADSNGHTYATPAIIMDRRAGDWERIWGDPSAGEAEVQRLPRPGREELVHIHDCEKLVMWPFQFFAVVGAVAPKPTGGDRILGQLPFVMKAWSKLRCPLCESWCDELAEFWDTAVRKSSALQASLTRAIMDECCSFLGITVGAILLDLGKFYDRISMPLLCVACMKQGFPAITLTMELHMYLAPRYLREGQWLSKAITVGKSVAAGSPHGGELVKAMLGPPLQAAHQRYQLSIMMRTFVDDTIIRTEGTESNVEST